MRAHNDRRRWATGLGVTGALALLSAIAAAKPSERAVDWTALNPAFAGATFVNDVSVCAACHEDAVKAFGSTVHARSLASGQDGANQCESCHGPRSKHVESPSAELAHGSLEIARQSGICLQCHQGSTRMGWKAGAHSRNGVSCTSCHEVMARKSDRALLKKASDPDTCYECHNEVRGSMWKASHHPVREGAMTCSSCHNAHGSKESLLVKNTLNETCYTCHADKRGPFLWEHAPVRESCANCHEAHGSTNRNLLTVKDSFLCLTCHSYGGHINLPRYNRTNNPLGAGCVNCHVAVHGSNHPSGAKQMR